MRILIVDADEKTAELTQDYLQFAGFVCDLIKDGEEALKTALKEPYDMVISETTLEKRDGFSLCSELRKQKDIPVMFLSSRNEEIEKVRAFSVGGDDYMVKPFSHAELVARVKRHTERYRQLSQKGEGEKKSVLCVRDLTIDKAAHRVYLGKEELSMPVREYELLLFLAENPNIVFSKERLFDRLWGIDAMGDVSTVTVHIQRIREKIEKDPSGKKYIETVWGAGYRFRT